MDMDLITYLPESIAGCIVSLRGRPVMVDIDLAECYDVEPHRLNDLVSRHRERFPEDFMFPLTAAEIDEVLSQKALPGDGTLPGDGVTGPAPMNGESARRPSRAFTELGILMLAGLLKSEKAVAAGIRIIREYVGLRRKTGKTGKTGTKSAAADDDRDLFFAIVNPILTLEPGEKRKIGFRPGPDD